MTTLDILNPLGTEANASATTIEAALKQLRARADAYRKYEAYYDGEQPLTFASQKYRDNFARMVASYTENMIPAVVDAFADRLVVTGFTIEGEGDAAPAWDLWNANRMDQRSGEVHKEAVKSGDAYVIVWPDSAGLVRIIPQPARLMTVHYDDDEAIDWAAKFWLQDDKKGRLNLYFTDRIEKWVTRGSVQTGSGISQKASGFVPYEEANGEPPVIQNPHGRVPVFHFANNADIGCFGRSDIKDVLPIQDALNKSVADLLVSLEFEAYAQRWATGVSAEYNDDGTPKPFEPGIDRLWSTSAELAKFGEFSRADLTSLVNVGNAFGMKIANVTGVPAHYLQMVTGNWPSGEALATAEARFVAKVRDRQIAFGNVWEDVMTFATQLAGVATAQQLSATWQDASPRSELTVAQVAVLKKQYGVSDEQLQLEAGYTAEEVAKMAEANDTAAGAATERQMQALNRFAPGDGA